MKSNHPVIGEQYRFSSYGNPYYGIGTVTSVSVEDRTGTMESEESGVIHFNDFQLVSLRVNREAMIEASVDFILDEINLMKKTQVLPREVKSFSELHDYIDANVLILKHVPRASNWMDASDEVREAQAFLDNLIMDLVSKELAS